MSEKMQAVLEEVIVHMVRKAKVQEDGTGLFIGSPRPIMETFDVSSGPLYDALYELGFRREGRGRTAKWTIPGQIMESRLGR